MSDNLTPSSLIPAAPLLDENLQKPVNPGNSRYFPEIIDPAYQLNNAQLRAIQLALDGLSWSRIAHQISVTPKTIWNWRNTNPDFQSALTEALANRQTSADQRTHTHADRASEILAQIMEDPQDKHRVRAAQTLLNASFRLRPKPTTANSDPDYEPWPEPVLESKVG
jgi:hypothetical protein